MTRILVDGSCRVCTPSYGKPEYLQEHAAHTPNVLSSDLWENLWSKIMPLAMRANTHGSSSWESRGWKKRKQTWQGRARGPNKACICKTDKYERTMPHRVLTLTPASVCDVPSSQGLEDRSGEEERREKEPFLNIQTASFHSGSRSGKFLPAVNTLKNKYPH